MEERTDQVLQTLNFHICLSPLKWCPTTEITRAARSKYASLKIWWRGCQLIHSHLPYLLMKMNYLCRHQMPQRYRPLHNQKQKTFHTVTPRTSRRDRERRGKWTWRWSERSWGGVYPVCVLFRLSFALQLWSPPGPVKSPHKFIKDENLFSIWKGWTRILKQLFIWQRR